MIIISSSEFRNNQKSYFDRVDKGEQVIVQRGDDKAYALTPITDDDMYFNSEMIEKIEKSIQQIKDGESITFNSPAEMHAYFDAL